MEFTKLGREQWQRICQHSKGCTLLVCVLPLMLTSCSSQERLCAHYHSWRSRLSGLVWTSPSRFTGVHRFVLVLIYYTTRYPETVALCTISAKSVAQVLFQVISWAGIPKEILTDQGTSFMSPTLRELYGLLGIKSILTSVYHLQTNGLVDRLNKTLKSMIRKFVHKDGLNWDRWLDPLLFAVGKVPQASLWTSLWQNTAGGSGPGYGKLGGGAEPE